jgi:hypothetical protein
MNSLIHLCIHMDIYLHTYINIGANVNTKNLCGNSTLLLSVHI